MSDVTETPAITDAKANSTVMEALLGGRSTAQPAQPTETELEDDLNDDEEVEPAEEQEQSEEETEEDELPQSVKDILAKNRKELREAKAELRKAAKELAELKAGAEPSAEVEAAKASENTYKDLYIATSAKAALTDAGLTAGTDRLVKMIDFSAVTIGADGSIDGLADQVSGLKEDFPELFATKAPKRTAVKADIAGGRTAPAPPKQTSADKIAAAMMGR